VRQSNCKTPFIGALKTTGAHVLVLGKSDTKDDPVGVRFEKTKSKQLTYLRPEHTRALACAGMHEVAVRLCDSILPFAEENIEQIGIVTGVTTAKKRKTYIVRSRCCFLSFLCGLGACTAVPSMLYGAPDAQSRVQTQAQCD